MKKKMRILSFIMSVLSIFSNVGCNEIKLKGTLEVFGNNRNFNFELVEGTKEEKSFYHINSIFDLKEQNQLMCK